MNVRRTVLALGLTGLLAGCGDAAQQAESEPGAGTEAEAAAVPSWVGEVAGIADAIEARPVAADSILEAHEMTRAALDSLLYEIAADPGLTEAYQQARGR